MNKTIADTLADALKICKEALYIAGDWHAPNAYDIEVPASWDDAKDPDSSEPTWPTLNGIVEKCEQALSAYDAFKGMGGWLPIESAPKDGTHIYVSYPTKLRTDIKSVETEAWWHDGWRCHYAMTGIAPTLWQPLPQPPLKTQNGDAQ